MLNKSQRIIVEAVKKSKTVKIVCNKNTNDEFALSIDDRLGNFSYELAVALQKFFNKENYESQDETQISFPVRLRG